MCQRSQSYTGGTWSASTWFHCLKRTIYGTSFSVGAALGREAPQQDGVRAKLCGRMLSRYDPLLSSFMSPSAQYCRLRRTQKRTRSRISSHSIRCPPPSWHIRGIHSYRLPISITTRPTSPLKRMRMILAPEASIDGTRRRRDYLGRPSEV